MPCDVTCRAMFNMTSRKLRMAQSLSHMKPRHRIKLNMYTMCASSNGARERCVDSVGAAAPCAAP